MRASIAVFYIAALATSAVLHAQSQADPDALYRERATPPRDLGRGLAGCLGRGNIRQRRTSGEPAQRDAQSDNGHGSRSARTLL